MNSAFYNGKPIASIAALSAALNVPEGILIDMSHNANKYYKKNPPQIKSNGKERITYRVDESLKAIHQKIKVALFQNVTYPKYLQGSIRDIKKPRDYISDARMHSGKRMLISEDVSDFFPSIKYDQVLKLWMYFFNFPKEIATTLTDLTTYKGFLSQGSKTSSYVANLIFWQYEPALYNKLKTQGITYSRYVDDTTLSFDRYVSNKELGKIISSIFGMMCHLNIKPNREKQDIKSRKNNTTVHNLNVTKESPTIPKKKKNNLRMAVFNCIKYSGIHGRKSEAYKKMYRSTVTRIGQLGRLHPNQSQKLKNKLAPYKP